MRIKPILQTALLIAVTVAISVPMTVALAGGQRFEDVPPTSTFYDDIEWLADWEVTLGCDEGRFCPDDPVTRQQMAAFMRRLAESGAVAYARTAGSAENTNSLGGIDSDSYTLSHALFRDVTSFTVDADAEHEVLAVALGPELRGCPPGAEEYQEYAITVTGHLNNFQDGETAELVLAVGDSIDEGSRQRAYANGPFTLVGLAPIWGGEGDIRVLAQESDGDAYAITNLRLAALMYKSVCLG